MIFFEILGQMAPIMEAFSKGLKIKKYLIYTIIIEGKKIKNDACIIDAMCPILFEIFGQIETIMEAFSKGFKIKKY